MEPPDGMRERLLARLDSGRFTTDQAERALAYLKKMADRGDDAEMNPAAEPK